MNEAIERLRREWDKRLAVNEGALAKATNRRAHRGKVPVRD
jgi:hypothetical protein